MGTYKLRGAREISVTRLPIETIVESGGKSDSTLDLLTGITFAGNGGAKINKFITNIESTIIDRNLESDTLYVPTCQQHIPRVLYFVLLSLATVPILIDSRSIKKKQ